MIGILTNIVHLQIQIETLRCFDLIAGKKFLIISI